MSLSHERSDAFADIISLNVSPEGSLPLTEDALRNATVALESSTRAYKQRTEALQSQLAALRESSSVSDAIQQTSTTHASYLGQRQAAQIQHITFANEQLFDTLRTELQLEQDNVEKHVKAAHLDIPARLASDDQSLQGLNDITLKSSSSPLDVEHTRTRIAELSSALHFYQVQTVKDLLDLTYLQCVIRSPEERSEANPASETSRQVQDDLGSLYSEIDDVVAMTVRQEHGNPTEKSLQAMIGLRKKQDHIRSTKIHSELLLLTQRMERVATDLGNLESRRHVLNDFDLRLKGLEPEHQAFPKTPLRSTSTEAVSIDSLAMNAVLNRLGIPANRDTSLEHLRRQIQDLSTKLQDRSTMQILQVLSQSREAVSSRASHIQRVGNALAHDKLNMSEVGNLESAIVEARAELGALPRSN
ncbi:hypothetical protein PV10_06307 [Exophiala mesophila]|uniref:Uncharacterized protein n=1 Tax=Exophiala mesophila TaxID=212818 RepID=A0A0D1ZCY2_EXOME|nr:uncharacterized protein PV10_06307 [Exophiala mesophila]KIV91809.1 hypothetical protein PV10_06307 [Exophiala mesophila]